MRRCEQCQSRDAVVHLTRIHGTTVENLHLCSACAAERGITVEIAMTAGPETTQDVATLDFGFPHDTSAARCPACSATLADIAESRRLGCSQCWSTFAEPLRELVQRTHGSTRHVGKRYTGPSDTPDSAAEAELRERLRLQRALQSAIADERFEDAATMRDQLRDLQR